MALTANSKAINADYLSLRSYQPERRGDTQVGVAS